MARPGWPSLVTVVIVAMAHSVVYTANEDVMTNQWHVHLVDDLGKDAAMKVAKRNGFSFILPVSPFPSVHYPEIRLNSSNILFNCS